MAYVKLDKEYASAIKNALTDISDEISLTLSSVSSSFYNKKISLSSSFLKKYDEEGELIVNYTGNAINYNTAADSGGDRAAALSSTISAKVKKVTNAIEKVLSLVETFEGQTGLSIEAEVGSDLSSAFQFLSQYGDASSLSALRGSGIFGNSSLNGIYDFDESILDYDGLSIWSSFGGFLDEQENEGELENNIREFFLGKLQAYLDENGNVVIGKKDLGALNALSMATLLQTDVGQQLKDEFENEYKDKISSMLFGEGTNEAGMMPFGTPSTEEEIMKSAAPIVTLLTTLGVGNKVASNKGASGGSDEEEENKKVPLIESINEAIMKYPEIFKKNEQLEVFGELISQLDDNITDSELLERIDAAGIELGDMVETDSSVPKKSHLAHDPRDEYSSGSEDGGVGVKLGHSLGADIIMGKYEGALDGLSMTERAEQFQEYLEENGIDPESMSSDEQMSLLDDFVRDSSPHNKLYQKELAGMMKDSKLEAAVELGSLAGKAGETLSKGNTLLHEIENGEANEVSDRNLDTDADGKPDFNSTESIAKQNKVSGNSSQNNSGQGASKVPSGGGGHGHKSPSAIAVGMQQAPVKVQETIKDIVEEKVQIGKEIMEEKVQTVETTLPKVDKKPSVGSELPKVPQIKNPSDSTIDGSAETKIELPEISKEEIKSSSAVVGAAGLGASAIISGSGGSVPSVPSVPTGGIVTPSAPTVSVDMDFAAPAPTPNASAPGPVQSGTVTNSATTVNAANSSAPANSAGNVGVNNAINPQTGNNANPNANANASTKSTITTHATESSSSKSEVLGKGKSSYGAPSDAPSGKSTNKAQSSEARADAEQQEQKTKVEDLDKQVNANAPEGVLGDSSYAELILKNEKEVKIATGITVSSLAFTLALKLTNIIGIVSFVLVLLAIVLVYTTFRIKKGKERKKLESLIIIEKIKKEEELATKEATEETVVEEVSDDTETEDVTDETVVEDGNEVEEVPTEVEETVENNNEETEENVVYEEEIVYVDEDGNVIELPEGAEVVYEEVVEEVAEPEVEIPEKKEFQSAEEVIYGEMPKKTSEEE